MIQNQGKAKAVVDVSKEKIGEFQKLFCSRSKWLNLGKGFLGGLEVEGNYVSITFTVKKFIIVL